MTPRNILTGLGWAVIGLWLWTYRTHLASLLQRDVKPYDPAAAKVASLTNLKASRS